MKSFRDYVSEKDGNEQEANKNEPIQEGFIAGSAVSVKLNSMRKRVHQEQDPKKQNDLIADMLHFGIGTIALVTNSRKRRL